MPTPKSTPARTRLEPPSPKAKVRPETTMATSESPRAMVLVNACCSTFTAFSQGELACAKAGAAMTSPKSRKGTPRSERIRRRMMFVQTFMRNLGDGVHCERQCEGSPRLQPAHALRPERTGPKTRWAGGGG